MPPVIRLVLPLALIFTALAARPAPCLGQQQADPDLLVGHAASINSAIYTPAGSQVVTGAADQLIKLWSASNGQLIRSLQGHEGQVLCLAVSPDNQTLVSGAADNTLRLWDLPRNDPLHVFEGHAAPVSQVVVGPKGRVAMSASTDKSLRLWDLEQRKIAAIWQGHTAEVTRLAYRADGNEVASADVQGNILLWNILTGKPLAELGAHNGEVTGLAYHPNNQQLVSTGVDGLLHVWQLPVTAARPVGTHEAAIADIAVTSDSQTAVLASGSSLQVVGVANGALVRELAGQGSTTTSLAISANDTLVAAANEQGSVPLWNLADGTSRGMLEGHTEAISEVAIHADNNRLATAGTDGTVRLWHVPQPPVPLADHTADTLSIAVDPQGKFVATGAADNSVRLSNPETGQAIGTLVGHEAAVGVVEVAVDASQLATADAQGELRLWKADDRTLLSRIGAHSGSVTSAAYHPSGKLLITSGNEGTVKTWPLPLPPAQPLLGSAEAIAAVAISADASFAVTGGADKTIRQYDLATGDLARAYPAQSEGVTALALINESKLVASGNAAGTLEFWNTIDGSPWSGPVPPAEGVPNLTPSALHGHIGPVSQIDYHPESGRLATAGADGTVRLWRLPTAPESLAPGSGPATKTVVSNDGTRAAIAGTLDGTPAVFIRNLNSGKLVHTLLGHSEQVTALAFNSTGNLLATGSVDKTARIWNLAEAKFPQLQSIVQSETITAVAFTADDNHLLVATADHTIGQWSLPEAEEVAKLAGHSGAIGQLLVRQNTLFSAAADSTVRMWNLATAKATGSVNHGAAVNALAVSTDGATIASGGADNSIKLWKATDGSPLATLARHATPLSSLAFSADQTTLLSATQQKHALWHVASGRLLQEFPCPEWPILGVHFASSPAEADASDELSRLRLAAVGTEGALRIYQPDLLRWIAGNAGEASGVQLLPDGNSLMAVGADNSVIHWDLASGEALQSFTGPSDTIQSISLAATGQHLAAASADQQVYLWDIAPTPASKPTPPAKVIEFAASAQSVQFSNSGQRLAIGLADNTVHVWDMVYDRELQRFFGHTGPVGAVAFAANGHTLLSGSADKTAHKWTVSAKIISRSEEGFANDLACTPDGRTLIAASNDPRLSVWTFDEQMQVAEPVTIPPAGALPTGWPLAAKHRLAINSQAAEIAVLDTAGQVVRWDLAENKLLNTIEPEATATESPSGCIAYAPEGSLLAIGTGDRLRIHDTATARRLEVLQQSSAINDIAFTAKNRLAVARQGTENTADLRTMALDAWWLAHEGAATSLAFTPDGNSLLTAGADAKAILWSLADHTPVRTYTGATAAMTDVVITPDGERVIGAAADQFVRAWPVSSTDEPTASVEPEAQWEQPAIVRHLSTSADSLTFVAAGDSPTISLWDLTLGKQVQRWNAHAEQVTSLALAADSKTIISGGADQQSLVLAVNRTRSIPAHEEGIADLTIYANGNQVATAGGQFIRLWNLANGDLTREIPCEAPVSVIAVRDNNAQLVSADTNNTLHLWNLSDGSEITQFRMPAPVSSLNYSADGLKIVATLADGSLRFFAPDDGTPLYELTSSTQLNTAAFTTDSQRVLTGSADGTIALWGYAAPDARQTLRGHGGSIYSVAISPDGTRIASASADQSIRLWDAATAAQKSQLTGHEGPIYSVAFSPDGALLVSCGADKSIRLWDVLGGRQLKQLPVGESSLYSVAFHPAGRLVATAGMDKKIYVYDVLDGSLKATFSGHNDYIYRVAYNQQGNRLLSCGYGGSVRIWNTANGQPLFEEAVGNVVTFADYAPQNDRIVVAGDDGRARIISIPATAR